MHPDAVERERREAVARAGSLVRDVAAPVRDNVGRPGAGARTRDDRVPRFHGVGDDQPLGQSGVHDVGVRIALRLQEERDRKSTVSILVFGPDDLRNARPPTSLCATADARGLRGGTGQAPG